MELSELKALMDIITEDLEAENTAKQLRQKADNTLVKKGIEWFTKVRTFQRELDNMEQTEEIVLIKKQAADLARDIGAAMGVSIQ